MKHVFLIVSLALFLIVVNSTAQGVTRTAWQKQMQQQTVVGDNDNSQVYLVAAGKTPQVRADSDAHWEWFDNKWPNAEQAKLIQRAAEAGDAQAQFRLALMYDAGGGVSQDAGQAVRWLRKAAEQGHVEAQYNLATMYDSGHGVAQDYTEAVRWYRAAAEQGYASAQKNLGVKYGLGQGVPQSDIEAFIWSAIAAQAGNEGAVDNRNLAASKLSANQLEAAQNWAAKRYQAIQSRHSGQ